MRKHLNRAHGIKKRKGPKRKPGSKTQKELSDKWYAENKDLLKLERKWATTRKKRIYRSFFAALSGVVKVKRAINTQMMYKLDGLPNRIQRMPETFRSCGSPVTGGKEPRHLGTMDNINFKLEKME